MQTPPLTRSIGMAERAMRALLEHKLANARLSFAEWTVLVFLKDSALPPEQVSQRQLSGHVVSDLAQGQQSLDTLLSRGLICTENPGGSLVQTPGGAEVFKQLSEEIENMIGMLYGDLPITDLEATHRTVTEIAKRANALMAQAS